MVILVTPVAFFTEQWFSLWGSTLSHSFTRPLLEFYATPEVDSESLRSNNPWIRRKVLSSPGPRAGHLLNIYTRETTTRSNITQCRACWSCIVLARHLDGITRPERGSLRGAHHRSLLWGAGNILSYIHLYLESVHRMPRWDHSIISTLPMSSDCYIKALTQARYQTYGHL